MKRNFAKPRGAFGKLLLIGSAILWTSCDDNGSSVSDDVVSSSATESNLSSSVTGSNSSETLQFLHRRHLHQNRTLIRFPLYSP